MLEDQCEEGQSPETGERGQSCLGKVKGDLSCLGELEKKTRGERFLLLSFGILQTPGWQNKSYKNVHSHTSPGSLMFVSLRTPKTHLLFGVMRLIVKLPQTMPFLAHLPTLWFLPPKETDEEGKGEAMALFVSRMYVPTSPRKVRGKWVDDILIMSMPSDSRLKNVPALINSSAFYDL